MFFFLFCIKKINKTARILLLLVGRRLSNESKQVGGETM